jgi:hypothetical protein
MMIMNCLTSTGSPNFIKHLTNKDPLLVPKKCSTKPLSILLTKILTAVKERLHMYCATVYAKSRVNQMWILKNSKELLENLKSPFFLLKSTASKPTTLQHFIRPYLMIN